MQGDDAGAAQEEAEEEIGIMGSDPTWGLTPPLKNLQLGHTQSQRLGADLTKLDLGLGVLP